MNKKIKRVSLEPDTNLLHILGAVHSDKTPRLIERNGEALAVVVDLEYYTGAVATTDEGISEALRAAGAWKDLDTDALIEKIYQSRHEAPPSQPVNL